MARNTRTYSDIDLAFGMAGNGDVSKKYDENAVKASIKHLILISNYEKPFHSEIGTRINRLLFEPAGPMLDAMLKTEIINTIRSYEPRAIPMDVIVRSNPDNNVVYVSITFRIVNVPNPVTLDLMLKRTR